MKPSKIRKLIRRELRKLMKASKAQITIDIASLPAEVYNEILFQGLQKLVAQQPKRRKHK